MPQPGKDPQDSPPKSQTRNDGEREKSRGLSTKTAVRAAHMATDRQEAGQRKPGQGRHH